MAKKKSTKNAWRSRIVAHSRVAPSELLPHEMNHRRHPDQQKAVVAASIRELGFVRSVIVNQRTGKIIDGHERVSQALAAGIEEIDVEYVDLSEDEERKALLVLDASSELATVDSQSLDELLKHVQTGEEAIASLIESMAIDAGIVQPEFAPATAEEQGRLDQFDAKMVTCPHCNVEFDCRGKV